jgi:hypothetical protein
VRRWWSERAFPIQTFTFAGLDPAIFFVAAKKMPGSSPGKVKSERDERSVLRVATG